jgi:DNA-directed RNA polymerase specialized sigma24 family protein
MGGSSGTELGGAVSMVEELVRTRYGALVGFATMLTGDAVEAEDVVQDACSSPRRMAVDGRG